MLKPYHPSRSLDHPSMFRAPPNKHIRTLMHTSKNQTRKVYPLNAEVLVVFGVSQVTGSQIKNDGAMLIFIVLKN